MQHKDKNIIIVEKMIKCCNKILDIKGNVIFYYFKCKFDGKDFWIRASDDENKNGRTIFENIGNLSTPSEMIEDYRVMDITGKSDRMIYEYLRTMGNRLR